MRKEAIISVVPFLKAKEKKAQRAAGAVAPADNPKSRVKDTKPEAAENRLSEYDKARLAILRGEE